MKKFILLSFLLAAFSMVAVAQSNEPIKIEKIEHVKDVKEGGPIMSLESNTVDYGTIKQHGEPLRSVKFTNTCNSKETNTSFITVFTMYYRCTSSPYFTRKKFPPREKSGY